MPVTRLTSRVLWAVLLALVVGGAAHAVVTNNWPAGTSFAWSTSPTYPASAQLIVNLAALPGTWQIPILFVQVYIYNDAAGHWIHASRRTLYTWNPALTPYTTPPGLMTTGTSYTAPTRSDALTFDVGAIMAGWQWLPLGQRYMVLALDAEAHAIISAGGYTIDPADATITTNVATLIVDTRTNPPTTTRLPAGTWAPPPGPLLVLNTPAITPLYGRAMISWSSFNLPAGTRLHLTAPGIDQDVDPAGNLTTSAMAESGDAVLTLLNGNDDVIETVTQPINVEGQWGSSWMQGLADRIRLALEALFNAVTGAVNAIGTAITNAVNAVASAIGTLWTNLLAWLNEKWGLVAGWWEFLRQKLIDLPSDLLGALANWIKLMFLPSQAKLEDVKSTWGEFLNRAPWQSALIPIEGLKTGMEETPPTRAQAMAYLTNPGSVDPGTAAQLSWTQLDLTTVLAPMSPSVTETTTTEGFHRPAVNLSFGTGIRVPIIHPELFPGTPESPSFGDRVKKILSLGDYPILGLLATLAIAGFLFGFLEKLKWVS